MGRTRVVRIFLRRPKYFAAVLVIVMFGAVLMVSATATDGVAQDVLINLGATALGVALTAMVLEPLIEQARRPDELIHSEFPHQSYLAGVERSRDLVRIMGVWPYVMDVKWRPEFLRAIRGALARGVTVQILMLDPQSKAAEQRSRDLDDRVEVSVIIADSLQALHGFGAELPAAAAAHFEVRVYSSLPPARLYRWDDRALSSFFPMGSGLGTDVRHYETNVTSGLGRFVDEQFGLVWADPDTQPLADYVALHLTMVSTQTSYTVPYVAMDGHLVLVAVTLADDIFRNSIHDATVTLSRLPVELAREKATSFAVRTVADDETAKPAIVEAFNRKYGTGSPLHDGFRSVVRLVPRH